MDERGAEQSGPASADAAGPPPETTRIRLDVAYDGTDFYGWTRQPGMRTVQGEIEAAFGVIFRRHPPLPTMVVAGRTDAGVHATGQVAHVDLTPDPGPGAASWPGGCSTGRLRWAAGSTASPA